MSKNELDFSCIEAYKKKLEDLGRKGNKIENEALEAGAEIILKEIKRNSPSKKSVNCLGLSKVKKIKGIKVVKVGLQKDDNEDGYYLKFFEWGTSAHSYIAGGKFKGARVNHPGQVARPFMRPAFENKKKEALDKTKDVIRKGLGI